MLPERPQVLTVAAVLPAVALLAVAGIALLQLQAAAPVLAGAGEAGARYPGATCGEKDADRRPPQGGQGRWPSRTARRCRHALPLTVLAVVAVIARGARADVASRADVVARLTVPAAPVLAGGGVWRRRRRMR